VLTTRKDMGRAHEERVDEYLRKDKIRNGIGRYKLR
jgi:hypothetical protein